MSWSKGQLIDKAFAVLALQGFRVNLGPEQRDGALSSLDAMMGMWNGKYIRLGYPLPTTPDASSFDQDSALPDFAIQPVYMNLAIVIASDYGKVPTPQTISFAKAGYNMLMARAQLQEVQEQQLPDTMPRGAGNKPWRWRNGPFQPKPTEPLQAGPDGPIEFT